MICQNDWDFLNEELDSVKVGLTNRKQSCRKYPLGTWKCRHRVGALEEVRLTNHHIPRTETVQLVCLTTHGYLSQRQVPQNYCSHCSPMLRKCRQVCCKTPSFPTLCFTALSCSRFFFPEVFIPCGRSL